MARTKPSKHPATHAKYLPKGLTNFVKNRKAGHVNIKEKGTLHKANKIYNIRPYHKKKGAKKGHIFKGTWYKSRRTGRFVSRKQWQKGKQRYQTRLGLPVKHYPKGGKSYYPDDYGL